MRRAALVVAAVVALSGCGDTDPSSPTAEDLREIDLSPDVTITVDEDGFEPSEVSEPVGTVFLLVNAGEELHSFTADDLTFDTGRLQPGDETTLVLAEPGTHTFHDVEAPAHEGTVAVATK